VRRGPRRVAGREWGRTEEWSDRRGAAFLPRLAAEPVAHDRELQRTRFTADGVRYFGGYCRLSKLSGREPGQAPPPHWLIGIVVPESDVLEGVRANRQLTVLLAVGVVALAVLAGLYAARQVARPLEQLARQVKAVGQLQIDARPVPHSIVLEVDRMAVATEEMKAGLRSFQKYVPADLVRTLLASGQEAQLGGERRTVTIAFTDIADFT